MLQRTILVILLFLCAISGVKATHIVGGELTYRCLGNNQYELTLIVYRDCYTGVPWFDNPASIGIFNENWDLVDQSLVSLDSSINDTLPIILSNPCLVVPPDVCVHGTVYRTIVNLPFLAGGYHLVYQRCCRNQLIRNIIDPLDTGASFTCDITEKALLECNNSAVFNQWPPVAICVNQPIDFDHSATDPDGDSLVYSICTPLTGATPNDPQPQPPFAGPYDPVVWTPDYGLDNVLGGDPLTIDPNTGFLTGIPNMVGNYVVGICVAEYRNGVLISTTRRDFQYNVSDCGQPLAAFFAPESLCDTLTYQFKNMSSSASSFRWYFDWENDLSKTSAGFSPVFTYPDTGRYTVVLIAKGSNPACTDTLYQEIYVTRTYADADLQISFPDCTANDLTVQLQDQSSDALFGITSRFWTLLGPNGEKIDTSSLPNPQFTVQDPGQYAVQLVVTSGNGCTATLDLDFTAPIPPLDAFIDSLIICAGDTIGLFPGADPAYTYNWSPAASLMDASAPNALAFPQQTTTYQVTISGNGPCVRQRSVKVVVLAFGSVNVSVTPDTILVGESAQLTAFYPGANIFEWTPEASLSNPNIANPVATPDTTTLYRVRVPLSSGCILDGTVALVVLTPFCEEPFVFFPNAFSPNSDTENDVLKVESNFIAEVYWVIYNRWGEKVFEADSIDDAWDGTYKGVDQPAETYGYYLRVKCINGTENIKQGNITLIR
jgi:gliding motility-associated-like protein